MSFNEFIRFSESLLNETDKLIEESTPSARIETPPPAAPPKKEYFSDTYPEALEKLAAEDGRGLDALFSLRKNTLDVPAISSTPDHEPFVDAIETCAEMDLFMLDDIPIFDETNIELKKPASPQGFGTRPILRSKTKTDS